MKLENEKQRLTELEAEYERKKNEYGGQMILGQVIELRRIVAVLEKEEPDETLVSAIKRDIQNIGSIYRTVGQALYDEPTNRLAERIATTIKRMGNE